MVEDVADGTGGRLLAVSLTGIAAGRDLDALFADTGRPLSRIDPLGELSALTGYVRLPRLVAAYRQPVARLAPAAVIGHCTAAALTIGLADDLARHGGQRPVVVLLDPVRPTAAGVVSAFERRRTALGGTDVVVHDIGAECARDPERALRLMGERLLGDATSYNETAGLSADEAAAVADELVGRYLAWLGFLLASGQEPLADPLTRSYHVLSADRDLPPGLGRTAWATTRRAPGRADELLMDTRVRDLVLDLIEESHG